jgi:hypothetical protein
MWVLHVILFVAFSVSGLVATTYFHVCVIDRSTHSSCDFSCSYLILLIFRHRLHYFSYGIIFWGSSSSMRNVFIIQKREIRIMLRLGPRSSCREGFIKLIYLQFLVYISMF